MGEINNFGKRKETVPLRSEEESIVVISDLLPVAPDGGWGWVIVLVCFLIGLILDGLIFSYGILLTAFAEHFDSSSVEAAWIGSLFSGVYLLVGPLAAGFVNKFDARPVVVVGSFILSFAIFISSWANSITYLILSYGCLGGIGAGFTFIPTAVYVGYYFEKRRATAMGIAAAGSGLGAIFVPSILSALLDEYTWSGTLMIYSAILLQCAVLGMLLRPLAKPISASQILSKIDKSTESSGDHGVRNVPSVHPLPALIEEESVVGQQEESDVSKLSISSKAVSAPKLCNEQPQLSRMISQTKHITAGNYAKSISRMSSLVSKNNMPSLKSIISQVDPAEFQRPFSRQDILYGGSIVNLSEFKKSKENFNLYHNDTVSILRDVEIYETVDGDIVMAPRKSPWRTLSRFVPVQIVSVLREMFNFQLMKRPNMILLCLSNVLSFIALYVPFVYAPVYAESLGYSASQGAFLLSTMGISNTIGRLFFGWFSDKSRFKALTISNWSLLISGAMTALFPVYYNYTAMAVCAAVFGFVIAAFLTLTSIVLVEEMGLRNLNNTFGLLMLFRGVASIIGSPFAGLLYDLSGSYVASFSVNGVLIFLSGVMCFAIPVVRRFGPSKKSSTQKERDHDLESMKPDIDKILDLLCDDTE